MCSHKGPDSAHSERGGGNAGGHRAGGSSVCSSSPNLLRLPHAVTAVILSRIIHWDSAPRSAPANRPRLPAPGPHQPLSLPRRKCSPRVWGSGRPPRPRAPAATWRCTCLPRAPASALSKGPKADRDPFVSAPSRAGSGRSSCPFPPGPDSSVPLQGPPCQGRLRPVAGFCSTPCGPPAP